MMLPASKSMAETVMISEPIDTYLGTWPEQSILSNWGLLSFTSRTFTCSRISACRLNGIPQSLTRTCSKYSRFMVS